MNHICGSNSYFHFPSVLQPEKQRKQSVNLERYHPSFSPQGLLHGAEGLISSPYSHQTAAPLLHQLFTCHYQRLHFHLSLHTDMSGLVSGERMLYHSSPRLIEKDNMHSI